MTAAAVAAARAAGYTNAGTIEFLVDVAGASGRHGADASFYFLEMNTRLQVEHPVTENTLDVDLVAAQLLVASGEPLPWRQSAIAARGHSIEARLYAEDPSAGFLPQAGTLLLYREPSLPGVRVDSGVREGDRISVHYDPLIAKVIATADTRERAIARLHAALRSFPVLGVRTNLELLLGTLDHTAFRTGTLDTMFLDRHVDEVVTPRTPEMPAHVRAAVDQHRVPAVQLQATATQDPWNGGAA
jgi:acetyl/propionyl-CoA carboxylase alpha subunit